MLVVKIEMWPGGDKSKAYPMGNVVITNDETGTLEHGNYEVQASHAGIYYGKRKEPYKRGSVKKFPRRLSPYRLLYRALKAIGET